MKTWLLGYNYNTMWDPINPVLQFITYIRE
jgi:hypothetical protein